MSAARIAAVIAIVVALGALSYATYSGALTLPRMENEGTRGEGTGRAVFLITDAAADMGSVSSVRMTVDSVSVHSATEGWITVSSTPRTYDLLQLRADGDTAVFADVTLDEGTYQQVRLDVSNVVVTDEEGDHVAFMPSGEMRIVGDVAVKPNATASVVFDFVADESLHVTGEGEYVFAPVVQFETREDARVSVTTGGEATVQGGDVRTSVRVGMDAGGNVGVGLGIAGDRNITIEGGGLSVGSTISTSASAGVGVES